MYKIIKNEEIANNIYSLEVVAPLIVRAFKPGQFVIIMTNEDSERIPLTIYNCSKEKGTITLIYQVVGASTYELSKENNKLYAVVGPLGKPSELVTNIEEIKNKKILFVAGGIGIAPIIPQAAYLHENKIDVDIIYGVKNKDSIILENELKNVCNNYFIMSDDGSYGKKGLVTDCLKEIMHEYDICVAIGPMVMMKYVSMLTKTIDLYTIVSLNPIMVDGTGMCGACRVLVNGEVKFACVDGPEFNGHLVDFDNAIKRGQIYKSEEGKLYLQELEGNTHHGGCGNCGE